jgi:hypothetical protein
MTAADIQKSFKQAEDALKRTDLDSLMDFYADQYKHRGFTKDSLKAEWKHLFREYTDRVPLTAQVTCTGSLWAISNDTNQRVNIDSWYNEIHYLANVEGRTLPIHAQPLHRIHFFDPFTSQLQAS